MTAAPTTIPPTTTAGPTAAPGETQGEQYSLNILLIYRKQCTLLIVIIGEEDGKGILAHAVLLGCQCMPDFLIYWLQAKHFTTFAYYFIQRYLTK